MVELSRHVEPRSLTQRRWGPVSGWGSSLCGRHGDVPNSSVANELLLELRRACSREYFNGLGQLGRVVRLRARVTKSLDKGADVIPGRLPEIGSGPQV